MSGKVDDGCRAGEIIKSRMAALGLTWKETTRRAKTDEHTLSQAIKHNGQRTSIPVLQRLAIALEIHVTEFWSPPPEESEELSRREHLLAARRHITEALCHTTEGQD